jgi:hypothetical protein
LSKQINLSQSRIKIDELMRNPNLTSCNGEKLIKHVLEGGVRRDADTPRHRFGAIRIMRGFVYPKFWVSSYAVSTTKINRHK